MSPVPEEIRDPFAAPSSRLYGSDTGVADAVWKSLTLDAFPRRSLNDVNDNFGACRACFAFLWTPEGRETLKSTPKLATWLDENASFRLGNYTLEEMPQIQDENSTWTALFGQIFGQSKKAFASTDLQYFLESMRHVVEGSMRLMMTT